MAKRMEMSVVGLRHRLDKPMMRNLDEQTPLQVKFVREPDNEHDANAIGVLLDEGRSSGMKIGYVPRLTAEVLAPAMDEGRFQVQAATLEGIDVDTGVGTLTVFHQGQAQPAKAKAKG